MKTRVAAIAVVVTASLGVVPAVAAGSASGSSSSDASAHGRRYWVYWDQNEEEDFLSAPSGQTGRLIPPWDPNGQMCLQPGGQGRFAVGYNPTLPQQHNPGGLLPYKAPPVGEAMYDRHGKFTGQEIFVPGPFHLPGQTVGGDIPPDAGSDAFNNNGTFTGCAFDRAGNLFATDLGTAQGQFPPPDDGRLIEWFGPSYTTSCIVDGPTAGGVGPHHVDGTGGLHQPGDMAFTFQGDLLLPEAGALSNGLPGGRVLRIDHRSLPHTAADCGPDGLYPQGRLRSAVFIQGSLSKLPFPISIARDGVCHCWAVATTFGDPAVAWFDNQGRPVPGHGTVPGEPLSQIGQDPNGYNPFGIAFAPDGTLYLVDIHIQCDPGTLNNCGPASLAGRVLKIAIAHGQTGPPTAIAAGLDFPTSVTVCDPTRQACPSP